jgi:hypothetical protein
MWLSIGEKCLSSWYSTSTNPSWLIVLFDPGSSKLSHGPNMIKRSNSNTNIQSGIKELFQY